MGKERSSLLTHLLELFKNTDFCTVIRALQELKKSLVGIIFISYLLDIGFLTAVVVFSLQVTKSTALYKWAFSHTKDANKLLVCSVVSKQCWYYLVLFWVTLKIILTEKGLFVSVTSSNSRLSERSTFSWIRCTPWRHTNQLSRFLQRQSSVFTGPTSPPTAQFCDSSKGDFPIEAFFPALLPPLCSLVSLELLWAVLLVHVVLFIWTFLSLTWLISLARTHTHVRLLLPPVSRVE